MLSASLCRHEAADENEAFEMMNLIDPVLRTSNSGAVLAAVNCFLVLTKDMPDMRYQVLPPIVCRHASLDVARSAFASVAEMRLRTFLKCNIGTPHASRHGTIMPFSVVLRQDVTGEVTMRQARLFATTI